MPEEAAEITSATAEFIAGKYDVDITILVGRFGWYFVGEIDCDYWYAILSPGGFNARFEFTDTGAILNPVRRKVLSLS